MIEKLYKLEAKIFEEFALETSNNIHVRAVDLKNPLSSVCKIFLSDIISSQIRSREDDLPIIIPTIILIEDIDSQKYCYLEIKPEGLDFIKNLFKELTPDNEKSILDTFRDAVLIRGAFFENCHWFGEDKPKTADDYERITTKLQAAEAQSILFQSPADIDREEQVHYVIQIAHELDPEAKRAGLTKKNIEEFLSKISILALHTKRHRRHLTKIQSYATKAAISQVMARNMSHNIGSHVSYRSTNSQIKKRAKELEQKLDTANGTNSPLFAAWLDYFADKLDKYEIYRNEYLSDFDLSPKSIMFYKDLVLPFCENMFVMDNIAAGEQLHYVDTTTSRLKIKCFINGSEIKAEYPDLEPMFPDPDGASQITYPDNFPYLLKHKDFSDDRPNRNTLEAAMNNKVTTGSEDVEICLHSEQAIYSILENFIRNSAKHNPMNGDTDLIVSLDLRKEVTHYNLHLFDNKSKAKPKVLFNIDENEPGIYQKLQQGLLDAQGKPRRSNWGYADMKINSFLLFNRFDDIDDSRLHENFKLVAVPENGRGGFTSIDENAISGFSDEEKIHIGYRIKLSVPRKILWVGEFESNDRAKLETEGLRVVDSLSSISGQSQRMNGLSSFEFAVINAQFTFAEYLAIEEQLPGRVIVLNREGDAVAPYKPSVLITKESDIGTDNIYAMLKWCWRQWLKGVRDRINLYLYFDNPAIADLWKNIGLSEDVRFVSVNNLQDQEILEDGNFNIVYNHHGGAFRPINGRERISCATDPEGNEVMNFAVNHSIVFFDKGSEDFASLHYPPEGSTDKELMLYQMIDAATTNVFIIDERISEYADGSRPAEFESKGVEIGTPDLGRRNWSMYAAGKLFVIHQIKKDETVYIVGDRQKAGEQLTLEIDPARIKLVSNIKNLEAIDRLRKDVLIVHRTYLSKERMGMTPRDFIDLARRQFGSVFITSGGGYPHNLDVNCRFISFSTIESCVNSRLAKNKLTSILRTSVKT